MAAKRRSGRAGAGRKIVFAALALGLVFAALEIAARRMEPSLRREPASPIAFQHLPESILSVEPGGRRVLLGLVRSKTNSLPRPKPPKSLRVFVLGGSAAWGMGFPHNGAFSDWLARMLTLAYPDRAVEVVNMASIGYGSVQEKAVLQAILDVGEPDLVALYSGHNEFLDIKAETSLLRLREGRARRWNSLLAGQSAFVRVFKYLLPAGRKMRKEEESVLADYLNVKPDAAQVMATLSRYKQNLTDMVAAAAARKIPLVLCTVLANPLHDLPARIIGEEAWNANPNRRDLYQAVGWARLGRWDKAQPALEAIRSFGPRIGLLRLYEAGGIRGMARLSNKAREDLHRACAEGVPSISAKDPWKKEDLYARALCLRLAGDEAQLSAILARVESLAQGESPQDGRLTRALFAQFGDDAACHEAMTRAWAEDERYFTATPEMNEMVRRAAARGAILAGVTGKLPDFMDPTPERYLLDYCHLNIEGAFEVARIIFESALAAGALPANPRIADFRKSLLEPDLDWLRGRGHDFTARDRWMGMDFRVCFAYAQPHPRPSIFAEWAAADAASFPDKEIVRSFTENRKYYE